MEVKYKIYAFNIIFSFLVLCFMFLSYAQYSNHHLNGVDEFIKEKTYLHKKHIELSFEIVAQDFNLDKKLFYNIHSRASKFLKDDSNYDLNLLKKQLKNEFKLLENDIDISLIDENYTIFDSTFKRDIGLNLSRFDDEERLLSKTREDGKIHCKQTLSIDLAQSSYVFYNFSKLKENVFLKLGFKDKILYKKTLEIFQKTFKVKNKAKIYNIFTNKYFQTYESLESKNTKITNSDYYANIVQFPLNQKTDDVIINTNRNKQSQIIKDGNIVTVYVPMPMLKEFYLLKNRDLVIKYEIDISDKVNLFNTFKEMFIIMAIFICMSMCFLFAFLRLSISKPVEIIVNSIHKSESIKNKKIIDKMDEFGVISNEYNRILVLLKKEIEDKKLLIEEHKNIISEMVHDIRTPLMVIMANSSLIEMQEFNVKTYIKQINCAIRMLSNSYEDLSYVISHDTIKYEALDINLSDFLETRIDFFKEISKANEKIIISQIQKDIFVYMNDIELERLIDNNITNAIKYGSKSANIEINLKKTEDGIILDFISMGNSIKNLDYIFEKNYREGYYKKSMGLGLNIVKTICEKNNIVYKVSGEDTRNIFTYIFKLKKL